MSESNSWQRLQDYNFSTAQSFTLPLKINEDKFIVVTSGEEVTLSEEGDLIKSIEVNSYNRKLERWGSIGSFPVNISRSYVAVWNEKDNCIYIVEDTHSIDHSQMYIIHLEEHDMVNVQKSPSTGLPTVRSRSSRSQSSRSQSSSVHLNDIDNDNDDLPATNPYVNSARIVPAGSMEDSQSTDDVPDENAVLQNRFGSTSTQSRNPFNVSSATSPESDNEDDLLFARRNSASSTSNSNAVYTIHTINTNRNQPPSFQQKESSGYLEMKYDDDDDDDDDAPMTNSGPMPHLQSNRGSAGQSLSKPSSPGLTYHRLEIQTTKSSHSCKLSSIPERSNNVSNLATTSLRKNTSAFDVVNFDSSYPQKSYAEPRMQLEHTNLVNYHNHLPASNLRQPSEDDSDLEFPSLVCVYMIYT